MGLLGPWEGFDATLEPYLVICAFSCPVRKCTDIWFGQCCPSVPATAQQLLAFLLLGKRFLPFPLLRAVLHLAAARGRIPSGSAWHLLRALSLPGFEWLHL